MEIVRNADGTLVVPVQPARQHEGDEDTGAAAAATTEAETRVLHPGEGGYDESLELMGLERLSRSCLQSRIPRSSHQGRSCRSPGQRHFRVSVTTAA